MRDSVLLVRAVFILAAPSLLFACGGGATIEQLGPRASFDLNCPPDQLSIVKLDDRTIGVQGCAQRATYIENCGMVDGYGGKHGCTWVMNNDRRSAQAAQPPPGYAQQPPPGMMPLPPPAPVTSAKPSPPPQ
jgi:hypothetical protein